MNNGTVANVGLNKFYSKIYGYLAVGIGVSAIVSYLILNVFPIVLITLLRSPALFYGLWFVELALVFLLGIKARQNPTLAISGFIGYAIINGITISATLLIYAQATVVSAFVSAAATFGAMSLVGMFTKKDLSAIGHAAYSALIGIIIAMVLNIFLLHSSAVSFFISILMVLIFSGITAYDNQSIRRVYYETNGQAGTGMAVFFALKLYLDFINLFLAFLRIFGKNK
ncbi:Bax inhibitor-1/YccA family protein [Enterococcus sp. UD-01]|jgi:FtsH-binding integral membrane protein|uniref:Bax inhibitor-1/YccA family protein n=1 Tax=Enterococcus sp. UD-01 TaxID=3373911 RepID=UPI00383946B7